MIQRERKLEQEKKILSKNKDPKNFSKSKNLSNEIKDLDDQQKTLQNKINLIFIFNTKHSLRSAYWR